MSVSVKYNGRTANNIVQYIVGHFIAKKYGLKLVSDISIHNNIKFGSTENGNVGKNIIIVHDNNLLDIVFGNQEFESPHFILDGFFNNRKFFEFFESDIKKNMTILYDNTIDKNSVMVHYRIGDLEGTRRVLPVEYYQEALNLINFNKGYITSDSLEHDFCKKLIREYDLTPINMSPVDTIDYCKNFNNLILSEGSFSWTIGFLSRANNIICSSRYNLWHEDFFLNKWKKLNWDYDPKVINNLFHLSEYKPIRYETEIGDIHKNQFK
jgi:hypothetical protein